LGLLFTHFIVFCVRLSVELRMKARFFGNNVRGLWKDLLNFELGTVHGIQCFSWPFRSYSYTDCISIYHSYDCFAYTLTWKPYFLIPDLWLHTLRRNRFVLQCIGAASRRKRD